MSVRHLLVTGEDAALFKWHAETAHKLLDHQRRGQTISYTCMGEDFDFAKAQATALGITLQETVYVDGEETYPVLVQGEHAAWPYGDEAHDGQEPTGTCVVCGQLVYDQDGNMCPPHKEYYADYMGWDDERQEADDTSTGSQEG